MNDARIRRAVHFGLIRHHHRSQNSIVVDELGIHHGQARIDIAVINGSMHGFEIKSEYDDLSRLPSQVESYNTVFNKLTLVVAEKYLHQAAGIIPEWWGVVCVNQGPKGGIRLNKYRNPSYNTLVESYAIAKLLWKNEALELLLSRGGRKGLCRERRSVLYKMLTECFDEKELHAAVRAKFKARRNWRDQIPPS